MAPIKRFEDIQAWQKARVLANQVYGACSSGKLSKDYGLRDQLCRAAVSVMANIAEGFGRNSDKEFARFLEIAKGSALEVQSHLYIALDAGHLSEPDFKRLFEIADETAAVISGFSIYLKGKS